MHQMSEDASDQDLIAAVLSGDDDAFGFIVRRYESCVAATVIGILGPGEDAEDVGQETMLKLYRSLGTFKGEAQLRTFLTRIAINASLDALKHRKRALKWLFQPKDEWAAKALEDRMPSDQNEADDIATRQAVTYALGQLKPEFRTVAVLRLMQGYSVEETAQILEVPSGTVLSRLSRAKSQLAHILQDHLRHV
jgi:RNA polymerase sigma-70 factor (ECF subfamily)